MKISHLSLSVFLVLCLFQTNILWRDAIHHRSLVALSVNSPRQDDSPAVLVISNGEPELSERPEPLKHTTRAEVPLRDAKTSVPRTPPSDESLPTGPVLPTDPSLPTEDVSSEATSSVGRESPAGREAEAITRTAVFDSRLPDLITGEHGHWHAWIGAEEDAPFRGPLNDKSVTDFAEEKLCRWVVQTPVELSDVDKPGEKRRERPYMHCVAKEFDVVSNILSWRKYVVRINMFLCGGRNSWGQGVWGGGICQGCHGMSESRGIASSVPTAAVTRLYSPHRKRGFMDCDPLPGLWGKAVDLLKVAWGGGAEPPELPLKLYIDIGANLGACAVHMLMAVPQSHAFLFEPHPVNFFRLTATLAKLPPDVRKRVVAFPLGLSSSASEAQIYSQRGNMGNSVVGKMVLDGVTYVPAAAPAGGANDDGSDGVTFTIVLRDLSWLLGKTLPALDETSRKVYVPLLKVDMQGFECEFIKTFPKGLAARLVTAKMEVASKQLANQNCSVGDYMDLLKRKGLAVVEKWTDTKGSETISPTGMGDYDIIVAGGLGAGAAKTAAAALPTAPLHQPPNKPPSPAEPDRGPDRSAPIDWSLVKLSVLNLWQATGNKGGLPAKVASSLAQFAPEYTRYLADDDDIVRFFEQVLKCPLCVGRFRFLRFGAHKADLFRYAVLWKFGGVWVDEDMEPLASFESLFLRKEWVYEIPFAHEGAPEIKYPILYSS